MPAREYIKDRQDSILSVRLSQQSVDVRARRRCPGIQDSHGTGDSPRSSGCSTPRSPRTPTRATS